MIRFSTEGGKVDKGLNIVPIRQRDGSLNSVSFKLRTKNNLYVFRLGTSKMFWDMYKKIGYFAKHKITSYNVHEKYDDIKQNIKIGMANFTPVSIAKSIDEYVKDMMSIQSISNYYVNSYDVTDDGTYIIDITIKPALPVEFITIPLQVIAPDATEEELQVMADEARKNADDDYDGPFFPTSFKD